MDWRLRLYGTLPSTSDLCITLAKAGEPEGLAVLAGRQSAGRGSHGRSWESRTGNLHLSLLLRPVGPASEAARWGLLTGVAVAEALAPYAPDIMLKWPNDALRDGAKLAGILVESATAPDGGLGWLVIGIGVNLTYAPEIAGRRTTCLGPDAPAPEAAARAVLDRVAHWRGIYLRDGFAPVRAAWLARAHPAGTELRLTRPGHEIGGRFAGLAEDGSLLIETGGQVRAYTAGELA